MDIPRELLAARVAAPADDGPRHVPAAAAAVGGERGELGAGVPWAPSRALAALRVLHPGRDDGDAYLVELAERFGAQLDQLVVVGDRAAPPALASLVAGAARTVARADADPAFGLGGLARSPAREDPTLVLEAFA